MFRLAFGLAIFALTLLVIMTRPYRISEAISAAVGAGLMLCSASSRRWRMAERR